MARMSWTSRNAKILREKAAGASVMDLAVKYGVSQARIYQILKRGETEPIDQVRKSFKKEIASWRKRMGLSVERAAEETGVSPQIWTSWERGIHVCSTPKSILKLIQRIENDVRQSHTLN